MKLQVDTGKNSTQRKPAILQKLCLLRILLSALHIRKRQLSFAPFTPRFEREKSAQRWGFACLDENINYANYSYYHMVNMTNGNQIASFWRKSPILAH